MLTYIEYHADRIEVYQDGDLIEAILLSVTADNYY